MGMLVICFTFTVRTLNVLFGLSVDCLSITNNQLLYILGVYIILKLFLFDNRVVEVKTYMHYLGYNHTLS